MKNKKSAFTLIEIAATTAIIGVLVVGVMSFSGGIIKSVENFKEKYPGYSDGYSDSLSTSLTRLTLDGSAIENMVISGIDATIEDGKIRIAPSGSGDPEVLTFDMPVDVSKDFSIVLWSNGQKHVWFTDDPDTYGSSYNAGSFNFYWKRWSPRPNQRVYTIFHNYLYNGNTASIVSYPNISPHSLIIQNVLTYESDTKTIKTYLQGSQYATYTFPESQEWTGLGYLKFTVLHWPTEDGSISGNYQYIDSVDIDNTKTLSASEISALYSAGSP